MLTVQAIGQMQVKNEVDLRNRLRDPDLKGRM